ncbi:MAG: Hsp33 family molecular chaperone HslO [Longimicrobiales bacterium]
MLDNTGYLIRATARDGRVRAFAIDSTALTAELQRRNGAEPAAAAALGRAATGAVLLASTLKGVGHSLTLRVNGGGPGGVILTTANAAGEVRGLIANPRPDVEQVRPDGKLNVSGVVGSAGKLSVVRDLGMRQPYASAVELISGEIGDDLAYYLLQSEQVPAAVGIGVFVRVDGSVEAAGGYMVQLMPGLADDEIASIEDRVRSLPHPTAMLRQGDTPERILDRIFPEGVELLGRTNVRFHCPCSRERAERALIALGRDELVRIADDTAQRGHTDLTCEFCAAAYRFSPADVRGLLAAAA